MLRFDYEDASRGHWDALHADARFRPRFPNEHVVRFLIGKFSEAERQEMSALDVGVGAGRHVKLLCEFGFNTAGIDISEEGLRRAQEWLEKSGHRANLRVASMMALPHPDACFDVAIAFGVYYYADVAGMNVAIRELHRVLKPGGRAFVVLRTTSDYRCGKGVEVEANTFRLEIDDTNEKGALMHFLDEAEVSARFVQFEEVAFEKSEFTFNQRRSVNSDWLIQVRK